MLEGLQNLIAKLDNPQVLLDGLFSSIDNAQEVIWRMLLFGYTSCFYILFLCRYFCFDQDRHLMWSNIFFKYLFLLVWPMWLYALLIEDYLLVSFSSFIMLYHLYIIITLDYLSYFCFTQRKQKQDHLKKHSSLKIFSSNLLALNPSPQGILSEILQIQPDLIFFQEYSQQWDNLFLKHSEFSRRFPHHVIQIRNDSYGTAIFSKTKLMFTEIFEVNKLPFSTCCVKVKIPGIEGLENSYESREVLIRVFNIHPVTPLDDKLTQVFISQMTTLIQLFKTHREQQIKHNQQVARQLSLLDPKAKSFKTQAGSIPALQGMLITGDFNTSQYNKHIQQLLQEIPYLKCCHNLCGRGYAVTFPNKQLRVPSVRLDHAFLSSDVLQCLRITEGEGQGSLHAPLIFEICATT